MVFKIKGIKLQKARTVISSLATVSLLVACGQPEQVGQQVMVPGVSVYSVSSTEVGSHREFVARTEPFQEANITARVEGELIKRHFTEGAEIEQGQLLFEIDPAAYEASLAQAKADLESKQSIAERAKRNLARGEDVAEKGFISQSDLDKLITEDLTAKSAVTSALASLDKANLDLGYTKISAPFSGRIGRVNFDTGNIVGPSSGALVTLTANDPMYVSFQIEEAEVVSYLQKQTGKRDPKDAAIDVSLKLPNNTVYDQKGLLEFADTKIGEGTGTIAMRATFENPRGIILPGLYVTLVMDGQNKESKILIPQMAVQENQQGKFVLVVDEQNKVALRLVKLARRLNAMWIVESGLNEGERVIIQGLQKVRAGVEVKTLEKFVDPKTGAVKDLVE